MKKTKTLVVRKKDFYVRLDGGNCSIVRSSSENAAQRFALQYFGIVMSPHVQEATPGQVSWVKAFGGIVHEID